MARGIEVPEGHPKVTRRFIAGLSPKERAVPEEGVPKGYEATRGKRLEN
jgi:hypothetical protein